MKRGQINNILIVVLSSFILILIGSIFNTFSLTGKASNCPKVPLTLFECPEGYSLVPNYNKEGCMYKYQCAVKNCLNVEVPDCSYKQAPYPMFSLYNNDYCVSEYECIDKPECEFIPMPPWKCTGENKLSPVYNSNGCVKYYQCAEGSLININ